MRHGLRINRLTATIKTQMSSHTGSAAAGVERDEERDCVASYACRSSRWRRESAAAPPPSRAAAAAAAAVVVVVVARVELGDELLLLR